MEKRINFNRRDFIRTSIGASASLPLIPWLSCSKKVDFSHRVIRIHNSKATKEWDYSANYPWDHTVEIHQGHEGKIIERYFDYINEEVVADMLDRGLRELTGETTAAKAWRIVLPGLSGDDKITIKMNLNNASFDENVTTNRMDQTIPLVNAVLDDLVNKLQLKEGNITLLDASRWFHPVIMKQRCKFPGVKWVDSKVKDRWDKSESVTFTKDEPTLDQHKRVGNFWMPKAYTTADHIINLCLMKNHGCGITGAMKNHFGSIPSPKCLHEGMGDKSYIADLCNTPSIRNKVRINIADALFANWHNNVWAPRPWKTFPEPSPNSLIMGIDPVAMDSVMLDHITEEVKNQGNNAPAWVRDCLNHHNFLQYAMDVHKLGIFEHKPYKLIDYRVVET
jgi:uncharacterized protein (DUF362 family)